MAYSAASSSSAVSPSAPAPAKDEKQAPAAKLKPKPLPPVPFRQLFRFADGWDKLFLIVGGIFSAAAGVIMPMFTYIFAGLLDAIFSNDLVEAVSRYAGYLALLGIAALVTFTFGLGSIMWSSERQGLRLRRAYMRALMASEIGYHDTARTAEAVSRMSEDVNNFLKGIGEPLANTLNFGTQFITGLAIGFSRGPKLAAVVCAFLPLLAISAAGMKIMLGKVQKLETDAYARAGEVATEAIGNIKTVASYCGEEAEVSRYDKHLDKAERMGRYRGIVTGVSLGGVWFSILAAYGVGLYYGATLILDSRDRDGLCATQPLREGCYTGGDVINVFFAIIMAAFAIAQAAPNLGSFGSACGAAATIFAVIDRPVSIDNLSETGETPAAVTGRIEFRDVTFHYPARPDVPVLSNFSLTIEAGQTVALVGPSGSGKSSIIALVQRWYDPDAVTGGAILLDGVALPQYRVEWLRERMGLVLQDPVLFGGTLADNIAYGAPELAALARSLTEEELLRLRPRIESAAKAANAHDFIVGLQSSNTGAGAAAATAARKAEEARKAAAEALPEATTQADADAQAALRAERAAAVQAAEAAAVAAQAAFEAEIARYPPGWAPGCGYRTAVGERGSQLSGGQRQRVCIARALMRSPKILLLDEATSALDTKSERVVQAAIDRLLAGAGADGGAGSRTSIVIAHRLSTIRSASRIVWLEAGRIIESGSHDELMALPGGRYRGAIEKQSLGRAISGTVRRAGSASASAAAGFASATPIDEASEEADGAADSEDDEAVEGEEGGAHALSPPAGLAAAAAAAGASPDSKRIASEHAAVAVGASSDQVAVAVTHAHGETPVKATAGAAADAHHHHESAIERAESMGLAVMAAAESIAGAFGTASAEMEQSGGAMPLPIPVRRPSSAASHATASAADAAIAHSASAAGSRRRSRGASAAGAAVSPADAAAAGVAGKGAAAAGAASPAAAGKGAATGVEDPDAEPNHPPVKAARVWAFQKPEIPHLALAVISAAVAGASMPAFSIIFARMTAVFYNPDSAVIREETPIYMGWFFFIGVCAFFGQLGMWSLFAYSGEKLTRRLRVATYRAVMRQEMAWFDNPQNSTGRLTSRLSEEASLIKATTGEKLALSSQSICSLIAGLVIAFTASWRVALLVLAVFPLIAFVGAAQVKMMASLTNTKDSEELGQILLEATSSIRTVYAFGLQRPMLARFDNALIPLRARALRRSWTAGAGMGSSMAVLFLCYALVFWAGGRFIANGWLNFQDLLQSFFAIVMAAQGAGQTSALATDVGKADKAKRSIFSIIDRKSAIDPLADAGNAPSAGGLRGEITLENVRFSYPTRPGQTVLNGLSVTVRPGQTLALVGPSGSGKSSIIALLQRWYDVGEGTVKIDGVDVRALHPHALRGLQSLVPQMPTLWADSVEYNIGYGNAPGKITEPDAGMAVDAPAGSAVPASFVHDPAVEAAALKANAHEFISRFPAKYATHVGAGGSALSGGQKSRVAIARALMRRPRILLADEATAALDPESERVVQAALDALVGAPSTTTAADGTVSVSAEAHAMTKIIVAHRLATIRHADVIAVVSEGRIVEAGTHAELMTRDGLYRQLALAQDPAAASGFAIAAATAGAPANATAGAGVGAV